MMNWPIILTSTVTALLVDLTAYLGAVEEWKRGDRKQPRPEFDFVICGLRAVIGALTGIAGSAVAQ